MGVTYLCLLFLFSLFQFEVCLSAPQSVLECTTPKLDIDRTVTEELLRLSSPVSEEEQAIFKEELGCSWMKKRLIDEYGYLSPIKFVKAYTKELLSDYSENIALSKAQDAANFCSRVKGDTPSDSALKILRCLGRWKTQSFINEEINQSIYKNVTIKTKKV